MFFSKSALAPEGILRDKDLTAQDGALQFSPWGDAVSPQMGYAGMSNRVKTH